MHEFAIALGFGAVVSLGLAAGALLAEAGVLVPYWRAQEPGDFLAGYARHAPMLLRFFGPLEVASGGLVVAATVLAWLGFLPGRAPLTAASALTLAVLLCFPLYFQRANASFASGSIALEQVAAELARWSRWHRLRTGLAIAAFALSLAAFVG